MLLFHVKHKFTVKFAEKSTFYGRNVFSQPAIFLFTIKKLCYNTP